MEITTNLKSWKVKNNAGKLIEATAENIINNFLTSQRQEPKTEAQHREIEERYLTQHKIPVKSYYKNGLNIIKFL